MSISTDAIAPAPPAEAAARAVPRLSRWSRTGLLGLAVVALWLLVALAAPWLMPHGAADMGDAGVFEAMSLAHPLGTDYLGRDMLGRVLEGARYTIGVALAATLLAARGSCWACWRPSTAAGSTRS